MYMNWDICKSNMLALMHMNWDIGKSNISIAAHELGHR
jgi:oligoendopeptidase F